MGNTDNIRHINWGQLELHQPKPEETTYGAGHQNINMIEERHADQLDWKPLHTILYLFRDNLKSTVVWTLRRNRTGIYIASGKTLLGGITG